MNKPDEWSKWMAMLMPACRKLGYGVTETSGMAEIGAKVGRLVYDGATPNPAGDSSGTGRSSK